jgi:iron only hydrogenase large subunit-like protein
MDTNYFHSVILKSEKCIGCTYCLKICPTEAIRLKNGKAHIIKERCIDCGECIRVCPNHAKNAITDDFNILKKFKYNVAIFSPVLYSQFSYDASPDMIISSVKLLGFDDVYDSTPGAEIISAILKDVIEDYENKPVISSSCPAIVRLIQVRFSDLIDNLLDMKNPFEITARLAKEKISKEKNIPLNDVGIFYITPCPAKATSIKNPIGDSISYIDGVISIRDIYGPMVRLLSTNTIDSIGTKKSPSIDSFMWSIAGGQAESLGYDATLTVSGINNAISVLEEIEMGRLDKLSFVEMSACPGGCIGGPLVVENRFIALNNIKNISKRLKKLETNEEENAKYMEMYTNNIIRMSNKIEPSSVMKLDNDLTNSIKKMNAMENIMAGLPGIDCGICGSPTCRAFAEDIVTGSRKDSFCPVNLMGKYKNR